MPGNYFHSRSFMTFPQINKLNSNISIKNNSRINVIIKFTFAQKMKEEGCENIFEASEHCSTIAKILGGNFVTVDKDKNGKYFAYTSLCDVLRVLLGIPYGIFLFYEVARSTAEKDENRSLLFEMIIAFNSEIEAIQPTFVMLIAYHFRFSYFQIKNDLKWIDEKVNFYCVILVHFKLKIKQYELKLFFS